MGQGVLRTWRLANGLTVEVEDQTINYYGDYFNVKLVIRCTVAVRGEYLSPFRGEERYEAVVSVLGREVEYRREILRAGVAGGKVQSLKEELLGAFETNALPYFGHADFARKFVQKRYAETRERLASKKGPPSDDNGS